MSEADEGRQVRAELNVFNLGGKQVWRWSVGQVGLLLSFPVVEEGFADDVARDLDFMIHHLPELVDGGMNEVEVQEMVREMEKELDEL